MAANNGQHLSTLLPPTAPDRALGSLFKEYNEATPYRCRKGCLTGLTAPGAIHHLDRKHCVKVSKADLLHHFYLCDSVQRRWQCLWPNCSHAAYHSKKNVRQHIRSVHLSDMEPYVCSTWCVVVANKCFYHIN